MKLSTRGRYALRAMLDLAEKYKEGSTAVRDMARRQNISAPYLEQILWQLKVAGMVKSNVGVKGGFSLSLPPREISLGWIINATEGSVAPTECVDTPGVCTRANLCLTRNVWVEMKKAMVQVLEPTTLQDLLEGKYRS